MSRSISSAQMREAIDLAVHAPSLHNTQPWRWRVHESGLQLLLDPERVLPATDPDGHSAALSCGAALWLARIAVRSMGWQSAVEYCPDDGAPDLLAELQVTDRREPSEHDTDLAACAPSRVSDRRLLDARSIGDRLEDLRRSSSGREAFTLLVLPTDDDRSLWLTVLSQRATTDEETDPAQVAELQRWVRHGERSDDGVPEWAVPQTIGGPRHSNVPQRAFDTSGHHGGLPVPGGVDEHPAFALIMTPRDDRRDHVRAGETMMQLMLEAWLMDVASCPASQAVDHVTGRIRLGQALGGTSIPQMIVRLGLPLTAGDPATTPRRPTDAVLED